MSDQQDQIPSTETVEAPTEEAKRVASSDPNTVIDDRYEVDFSNRCPQFDTYGGEAFAAQDLEDTAQPVYALVCRVGVPLRFQAYQSQVGERVPHMSNGCALGILPVREGGRRQILVIDRSHGSSAGWNADAPKQCPQTAPAPGGKRP